MFHQGKTKRETAVFVGFGMSGLSQFCSYVNTAIQHLQKPRIIIFEKNEYQFVTGEPYRLDTPVLWLLNGPRADEFQIPINDMSLYDWIKQNHEYCHRLYGEFDDYYPPRAVIGEYLRSRYATYKLKAEQHGIEVEVRYVEIKQLAKVSRNQFLVEYEMGTVTADYVALGLGAMQSDCFQEMKCKDGYVHNAWRAADLDVIPEDVKEIVVIGGHLTFVDIAKYLLMQRNYKGNFVVATRHPNMVIVRDYTASINEEPIHQLKEKYESHEKDKLSFQSAYTLFKQAYYATAKNPVDKQISSHYALTTQIAAQDKAPVALEHGDIDELCAFVNFFCSSETYRALWLALDPEGQLEFSNFYFSRVLSFLAGIPMVNARLLKEWYDTGRVIEMAGMTALKYDDVTREFVCTFKNGSEKRAKYVVNATGFGRDVTKHFAENPLLADLVQSSTIEITQHGGIVVNEYNHVLAQNHTTINNLAAVGPGVYKDRPSGEASYFIAEKAENAAQEHFRSGFGN